MLFPTQRFAACGFLAILTLASCSRAEEFTDLMSSKTSPDGRLIAAYVVDNPGLGAGTNLAITVGPAKSDPLKARSVLTWGEDGRPPGFDWLQDGSLLIRLPCGMWGDASNFYQEPGTDKVTTIKFRAPAACPPPNPGYPARFHGGGFMPSASEK